MMGTGETYIFVIDTDGYAGNFHREMCAYVTGHVGESGAGDKEREIYINEVDEYDDDLVSSFDSEPSSIWPSPAESPQKYGSAAIYLWKKPEEKWISLWKERAIKFFGYWEKDPYELKEFPQIQVLGFRLLKHVSKIESEENL